MSGSASHCQSESASRSSPRQGSNSNEEDFVPPELTQDYVDEEAVRVFAKVRKKAKGGGKCH
jgi:hypothetical protein